jgi:hypothetical protein
LPPLPVTTRFAAPLISAPRPFPSAFFDMRARLAGRSVEVNQGIPRRKISLRISPAARIALHPFNASMPALLRHILTLARASNLPTVWSNCLAAWFECSQI